MEKIDRLGWAAGISFVCHGARIGIRVSDPAILDQLREHLPPGWKPSPSPIVDSIYSLLVGRSDPNGRVRRYHLLYWGAGRLARTMDLDDVFQTLESSLHLNVAYTTRNRLFVQAGVLGWRGRAIVIPGRDGSGKTTLVEALVRAGATYYSDEFAVFDEHGRVHPYAVPLSMPQENGAKPKKSPVEELGGVAGTRPLPVGLIVVTGHQARAQWRPRVLSPGEAVLALLESTLLAHARPDLALATLQHVVSAAVTLKGKRGEAQDIIESLLSRLETESTRPSREAEAASRRNGPAHAVPTRRPRAGRKEKVP